MNERNGTGNRNKQIKTLRVCDMFEWGGGVCRVGILIGGKDRRDDGINDPCQHALFTGDVKDYNGQIDTLKGKNICRLYAFLLHRFKHISM